MNSQSRDLLHVDGVLDDVVGAGHLLDVRLELAHVLAHDLGVDDLALGGHLGLRRGRERNCRTFLGEEIARSGRINVPSLYRGGWPTTSRQLSMSSWPDFFARA